MMIFTDAELEPFWAAVMHEKGKRQIFFHDDLTKMLVFAATQEAACFHAHVVISADMRRYMSTEWRFRHMHFLFLIDDRAATPMPLLEP